MNEPTAMSPFPMQDPWVEALVRRAGDAGVASEVPDGRPAGRVLRLKLGYNPNSSSVGSVVTTLLWGSAVGAAMLNIAAVLVRREAAAFGRSGQAAPPDGGDATAGADDGEPRGSGP